MGPHDTTAGAAAPHRPRLGREILVALIVKTALLAGLWWLFFAQAPGKDAVAHGIGAHLTGAGATAPAGGTDPSSHKEQQP